MKYFIVFYFLSMLFVFGKCSSKYCTFQVIATCGKSNTNQILEFIPPISGFVSYFYMFDQQIEHLQSNAFQNLSSQNNVSHISLTHCKVRYIDADAFLNLYSLTSLTLPKNYIKYVDSKIFQHVTKLTYIDMKYNQIELLPKGIFENLLLLETVSLSSNQIKMIETDTFRNTPLLKFLHLDGNKLQYLDVSFKDSFLDDTFLYLENNPWTCDCNLIDVYDLYMRRPHNSVPICENPPILRGTRWTDLTWNKFVCDPRIEILLNETNEVPIGGSISLPCVVYSHDKPVMKWRKESTIHASEYLSTSSYKNKHFLNYTFVFEEGDTGVYYCSAEFANRRLDANVTLRVYNRTRYQQVDTGPPQPSSVPNLIPYTILFLVLVCVTAVIIGIAFIVRYTLVKSKRRRHVRLPTIVRRRSFRRTNARNGDNVIPRRVAQNSAMSEHSDSESSTNDMDEEPTLIHHYEIREATRD